MSPEYSRCTPSISARDRSRSEPSRRCHSTCRSRSRSGSRMNPTSSSSWLTGGCRTKGLRLVCRWRSPVSGSTSGRAALWASTIRLSNSSWNCQFRPICRRTGRCLRHSRGGPFPWASVASSANRASILMVRCGPMRAGWWLNSSIGCAAPAARRRRDSRSDRPGRWHRLLRPGSPMPRLARIPKQQRRMQPSQLPYQPPYLAAMGPTPMPVSRPAHQRRPTRSNPHCHPT